MSSGQETLATKKTKNFLELPTAKNSRINTRKNSNESDDYADHLT